MSTETSTKALESKYLKYQSFLTMTYQPPVLDTMDISTEITNNTTTDTPLFAEGIETPNEPTDSTLNNPNPTTAEKNKKERRNEKNFDQSTLHRQQKRRCNQEKNWTWCGNRIQKR